LADIADVENALMNMAGAAAYPNGFSSPSITGKPVTIFRGWPNPTDVDAAVAADNGMVSVFTIPGSSGGAVFQILDKDYLVVPPVHGLTITSIANGAVNVMGAPSAGEYLTIIVEGKHAYSHSGADLPTILNLIAADAIVDYPGVFVFALGGSSLPFWTDATGGGIQFPTDRLMAHIGAPATKGKVTHRQRIQVAVTAWAADPNDRDTISAAVDAALKAVNRLVFPDTSRGLLFHARSVQVDRDQSTSVYRRDLIFSCEYATLQLYQAWEVTSVNVTESSGAETTFVIG
jgi:hypothetical protein